MNLKVLHKALDRRLVHLTDLRLTVGLISGAAQYLRRLDGSVVRHLRASLGEQGVVLQ